MSEPSVQRFSGWVISMLSERPDAGYVLGSDYDALKAEIERLTQCRQDELAYIRGVLENIKRQEGEAARESAADTLLWLNSRATCYPTIPSAQGEKP